MLSDVLGLSSLVEGLNAPDGATEPTVLGPFYLADAHKELGEAIGRPQDGEATLMRGQVTDTDGQPLAGATLDVWQCASNGLYDIQDPQQPPLNLPEDAERLDEASIVDDEIAARLRMVEHDLVDAYVRGRLTGDTLARFESHYLASPRRREAWRLPEGSCRLSTGRRRRGDCRHPPFVRVDDRQAVDPRGCRDAVARGVRCAVASDRAAAPGDCAWLRPSVSSWTRTRANWSSSVDRGAAPIERQRPPGRSACARRRPHRDQASKACRRSRSSCFRRPGLFGPVPSCFDSRRRRARGTRAAARIERVSAVSGRAQGPGGQHHRLAQRLDRREIVGWRVLRPSRRSRWRAEAAALLARSQRAVGRTAAQKWSAATPSRSCRNDAGLDAWLCHARGRCFHLCRVHRRCR